MIHEEIWNMLASHELDQLIINKVMKPDIGLLNVYSFFPSRNILQAFDALYKWLDDHKTYAVHIETINITTGRLHNIILWGMDEDPVYDARAEDLALAICRVLLFAVMDNKDV